MPAVPTSESTRLRIAETRAEARAEATATDRVPVHPLLGAGRSAEVVVVSDRVARGDREPSGGRLLVEWLRGLGYDCGGPTIVAEGADGQAARPVLERLLAPRGVGDTGESRVDPELRAPRLVVTTGGTGIAPRNRIPEITRDLVEFEVPGIQQALLDHGLRNTPHAALGRGIAGVRGATLLVNLPGSNGGVRDGIAVLTPLLPQVQSQLEDDCG
ncbi:MogA/MoaB family molybdenum cofactor biosynthesis protein [Brevibacterium litoralis]|uniref:MogA/MoaB family molybdenum cofactor biosynthesis protein n=1 Tax=Brevibacterium litoralis TaxID=3138935 RepID=UPI0032EE846B